MKSPMPVFQRALVIGLLLCPVIVLTACDDSWDVRPYYDIPYSYERTAGHGVEWVQAHMMKKKAINAEPLMKVEDPDQNPVRFTTRP